MKCKKSVIYLYSGILLIVPGILFILLENFYYQYVDTNGLLHESLFLPLGALSLLLGSLVIFFSILLEIRKTKK
jgi:hypothetical protein